MRANRPSLLASLVVVLLGLALMVRDGRAGDQGFTTVPAGSIVLWSGAMADIPTSWHLCDGTSGTPDLRNSFIKCVASAEEPGGTGGAGTVPAEIFTGTQATLTHSLSGTGAAVSAGTPAGTVAAPTFTGSLATIATEPVYHKLAFIMRIH